MIAHPVKSTKFDCVQKVLDDVFEKEGYPKAVRTDNGPPFNSSEFSEFCKKRDIALSFSTPLFPQQNGLAESCMKLVNKAMATATANNTNYIDELKSAINAHNAAEHSVTTVPPEEVMYGRRIKRGLPLIQRGKSNFSEAQLEHRDREEKLAGKRREDERRGARKCRVSPGDDVVIERQNRVKGESRFSPTRYTVVEQRNGSLVLNTNEGKTTKRHVSQTKKVNQWRDSHSKAATITNSKTNSNDESTSAYATGTPSGTQVHRPLRDKKAPAFLSDYVRLIDKD
ncbi:uncharacterized protein K02A2.6-like [Aedes albopictus]|uniref:Integrase catalytic domain-containing protein n=1 Tax=Aedes albopictus TaxID=7160 RepID=A0ABM1YNA7_AEDAL